METSKCDPAMGAVQNASEEVTAFVPVERFEPFYITVKQCAARVGLSYWTICHWIADGKLTNEPLQVLADKITDSLVPMEQPGYRPERSESRDHGGSNPSLSATGSGSR